MSDEKEKNMELTNDDGYDLNGCFSFKYKDYEVIYEFHNGAVETFVSLNGENLEGEEDKEWCSIPDVLQWIDEDIRCRKEENTVPSEKVPLKLSNIIRTLQNIEKKRQEHPDTSISGNIEKVTIEFEDNIEMVLKPKGT